MEDGLYKKEIFFANKFPNKRSFDFFVRQNENSPCLEYSLFYSSGLGSRVFSSYTNTAPEIILAHRLKNLRKTDKQNCMKNNKDIFVRIHGEFNNCHSIESFFREYAQKEGVAISIEYFAGIRDSLE